MHDVMQMLLQQGNVTLTACLDDGVFMYTLLIFHSSL